MNIKITSAVTTLLCLGNSVGAFQVVTPRTRTRTASSSLTSNALGSFTSSPIPLSVVAASTSTSKSTATTLFSSSEGNDANNEESTGSIENESDNKQKGAKFALGSFCTTIIASLILFFGADEAAITAYQNDVLASSGLSNNVVAVAADKEPKTNIPPPPVTATSSAQSLKIGEDLKELNTRFFGAYWCSHCYEQKQRLGKEAMTNVQYIECAKDGLNSQTPLCKEAKVPGYPTWEIGGKLYPGEMYLDELEEIIANAKKSI